MIKLIKELDTFNGTENIIQRIGVRAIVVKGNKILLIKTSKGDYKFPGGGIEASETYIKALKREVQEETGYTNVVINPTIEYSYIERKYDTYEENTIFESISYYMIAHVEENERVSLQLDPYEQDLQFSPQWIEIEQAIKQNSYILLHSENPNPWVERELMILQSIWLNYKQNLLQING